MKTNVLIAVGKLKTPHFISAAAHYTERIRHNYKFDEIIIRDGDSSLSALERKQIEGERILKALTPKDILICLDEHGTQQTSPAFARFLAPLWEHPSMRPCFVIGGAYGISEAVLAKARHTIALSYMTFPHEMARVLLLEQLYRADAILRGAPYHHV